jgi:hypothetical protein
MRMTPGWPKVRPSSKQHVEVHRLHVRDFVAEHQAHFFEQMAN